MMMRRYSDAIKAFAHILLFVSRTKQYHSRSYQFEAVCGIDLDYFYLTGI
jgi:translation initiation factor 3 subunit L